MGSYFVPVVVALAIITFAIWTAVGMAIERKSGSQASTQSITYAVTVLIVSCPCAIGLAVPMVVLFASGIAAEKGVIFKSAGAIEAARKTSHVVFDKTGTLTQGELGVVVEHYQDDYESKLHLLLGLIGHSKHPVSDAISNHLRSKGIVGTAIQDVNRLTGQAWRASWVSKS